MPATNLTAWGNQFGSVPWGTTIIPTGSTGTTALTGSAYGTLAGTTAGSYGFALTGVATVANLFLYLAVQVNPVLSDSLKEKFASDGLTLLIDYPLCWRQATSANTQTNIIFNILPTHGLRCKKVITTMWNTQESINLTYDQEQVFPLVGGQAIIGVQSLNTYLDGQVLQPYLIKTDLPTTTSASSDSWRWMSKYCRDTCIFNERIYNLNWFWCDSWEMMREQITANELDRNISNTLVGFPLDRAYSYVVQLNTSNTAFVWILMFVFQRMLRIDANQIAFVTP